MVMMMTQEQEAIVQKKLFDIIGEIGVTEEEFHKNTIYHGQDQRKGM